MDGVTHADPSAEWQKRDFFRVARKAFLVGLPLAVLLIGVELGLSTVRNSYEEKRQQMARHAQDIEILVLGGSATFMGIDPAHFAQPAYNLANSSQSLYYDFKLLEKYAPSLPRLRLGIIGVHSTSLRTNFHYGPENWRQVFYDRYYDIQPEMPESFSWSQRTFWGLYSPILSARIAVRGFRTDLAEDVTESGWSRAEGSRFELLTPEGAAEKIRGQQPHLRPSLIAENAAHVERIIQLLKARGASAKFVVTPVTAFYSAHANRLGWLEDLQVLREIAKRYDSCVLDYSSDPRFELRHFRDNDHLNAEGAAKFSKILAAEVVEDVRCDQRGDRRSSREAAGASSRQQQPARELPPQRVGVHQPGQAHEEPAASVDHH